MHDLDLLLDKHLAENFLALRYGIVYHSLPLLKCSVLDIMGCSPKLRHKVVLAVIGCRARLSSLLSSFSFLFTSLFSTSSLPQ